MRSISIYQIWFFIAMILFLTGAVHAAVIRSGEEQIITEPVNDNLYVAAGTVTVDAIIRGDLMAAGGQVSVNDTVFEDLTIAGGDILINAFTGGDVRVAGGSVKLLNLVRGDLIVMAGDVQVGSDAEITGDVIIFGGNVFINGHVEGEVMCRSGKVVFSGSANKGLDVRAGELTVNGVVNGPSVLAAGKITLRDNARFHDNVTYWQEDGELNFNNYLTTGKAVFDTELEFYEGEVDWKYLGLTAITFWILYMLSVLLTLVLLVLLFHKAFARAGEEAAVSTIRNFGYGALYFIGVPLISLFSFITIIGIPVGMVLLSLYIFSLLFANCVASVVLAYAARTRMRKDWNKWQLILAAAIIFLALKILAFIPFIGILIAIVVIGVTFGALIVPCLPKREKEAGPVPA